MKKILALFKGLFYQRRIKRLKKGLVSCWIFNPIGMAKKILLLLLIFFLATSTCFAGNKPPLGRQIDWSNPITKGLVGCWLFNEGGGDKVYDLSGYGNTGTLTNMAFPGTATSGWNPGKDGVTLKFDGSNDHIAKTNIDLSSLINSTISGWFCPEVTYDSSEAVNDDIFGCYKNTTTYIVLQLKNSGVFRVHKKINNVVDVIDSNATSWTGGQWYHFTYTQDSVDGMKLYIDGAVQDNTNADTSSLSNLGATNWLRFGDEYYNGSEYYHFKGSIENIRIRNRALIPQEVQQLYIDSYGIFKRDRIALWESVAEAVVGIYMQIINTITTF